MKIVYITSELYPFMESSRSSSEELPESVYYMSVFLSKLGNEVSVFLPLYGGIDKEKFSITNTGLKTWVTIKSGTIEYEVWYTVMDGVTFYFMHNSNLFSRIGVYGSGGHDFADNDIRYSSYCRACLNFISYHIKGVDIIHSFNWETALIPVYKHIKHPDSGWKTVHTITNISVQGIFPRYAIENIGISWDFYHMEQLEFYDNVNFTKGALIYADAIISIEHSQLESFLMTSSGFGLDGVFRKNQDKLFVIRNGIDYDRWSPETDRYIDHKYSSKELSGKAKNKEEWCIENNFNFEVPLFCAYGKYMKNEGMDIFVSILPKLETLPVNFCFAGSCDDNYLFITKNNTFKNISFHTSYDEKFIHRMIASSDFMVIPFINPFRGMERWVSMRYGTIPIIRGFSNSFYGDQIRFTHQSVDDFWDTINDALRLYYNISERNSYISDLMEIDNSWTLCAKKYDKLYRSLLY